MTILQMLSSCCCGFDCQGWISCLPPELSVSAGFSYTETFTRGTDVETNLQISMTFSGLLRRDNPSPQLLRTTEGQWSIFEEVRNYASDGSPCGRTLIRLERYTGSGSESDAISLLAVIGCSDPCVPTLDFPLAAHSRLAIGGFGLCDFLIQDTGQDAQTGQTYRPLSIEAVDAAPGCVGRGDSFVNYVFARFYEPFPFSTHCPPFMDRGFFCKDGRVVSVLPIESFTLETCPVSDPCGAIVQRKEFTSFVSL
jgi:hypothetical protein